MDSMDQARDSPEPTFVLVDTCVWRSQPLLRTPLGASLIYYVHRTNSKIALPEVVELEITKQLLRAAAEARSRAVTGFGALHRIMGRMLQFTPPGDDAVREAIERRFDDLAAIIQRVPFTLDHARGALRRVIDETPPNGPSNQQFKDSAIWEAARELARRQPVLFVTEDKAFFEARDPKKGVARVLLQEIEQGVDITVCYGLEDCLNAMVAATPDLDRKAVGRQLDEQLRTKLNEYLEQDGWVAKKPSGMNLSFFATEQPSQVTVSVKGVYPLDDLRPDENRMSPKADVQATATYDVTTEEIVEVTLDAISPEWTDIGGERHRSATVFGRAALVFAGQWPMPITISTPVEDRPTS